MIKLSDLLDVRHLSLGVRACPNSVDEWIRWAQPVEDLEDADRLAGRELVLTAGRWRRSPADADRYACALAQKGVSALGAAVDDVTLDELTSACERWRLPLIAIPEQTTCQEVAETALTLILDRRGAPLAHSLERERSFAAALAERDGIQSMLSTLHREVGRTVWLLTSAATFAPSAAADPEDGDVRAAAEALAGQREAVEFHLPSSGAAAALPLAPPPGHSTPPAHLICEATLDDLSADDRLILERALAFLTLRLRVVHAIRSERRATAQEFLRRAGSGDAGGEELEAWVRALGIEPRGHVVCVIVRAGHATPEGMANIADGLEDMADVHGLRRIVLTADQEAIAFLFPGRLDERIQAAIRRSELALAPALRHSGGALGSSSVMAQDIADVVRTLHDARRVCQLNLLSEPEPEPESEGRLAAPPLSTLLLMNNEEARVALHAALLEPLIAYDEEHSSDLVHTLDVFLSNNGGWSASAGELGVHVNTLRYRLSRIEKCTGRDLASMGDRVDFYVALRARSLRPPGRRPGVAPDGRRHG